MFIFIESEIYVLLHCSLENPRLLRYVCNFTIYLYSGLLSFIELIEDGKKKHWFPAAYIAVYQIKFTLLNF